MAPRGGARRGRGAGAAQGRGAQRGPGAAAAPRGVGGGPAARRAARAAAPGERADGAVDGPVRGRRRAGLPGREPGGAAGVLHDQDDDAGRLHAGAPEDDELVLALLALLRHRVLRHRGPHHGHLQPQAGGPERGGHGRRRRRELAVLLRLRVPRAVPDRGALLRLRRPEDHRALAPRGAVRVLHGGRAGPPGHAARDGRGLQRRRAGRVRVHRARRAVRRGRRRLDLHARGLPDGRARLRHGPGLRARPRRRLRERPPGQETGCDMPHSKGASLGRVPLVSADFWTSDHVLERSRRVPACSGTHTHSTLASQRRRVAPVPRRRSTRASPRSSWASPCPRRSCGAASAPAPS